jgi:hypothetical protein
VKHSQTDSEVIPTYIKGFDAYLVEYFDEAMIDIASEELKGLPVNPRQYVHRVGMVSFFDEELCHHALQLTPAQIAERVHGKAERVELLLGGVFIVGVSAPVSLEYAVAKCKELTAALLTPTQRST